MKYKSEYDKSKWVYPKPTKSGRGVMEIWNDLKHAWKEYKMANVNNDEDEMVLNAIKIQEYQNDLGMKKIDSFPILSEHERE